MTARPTPPICVTCSRNARTVDTPRVKVRVESYVVYRDGPALRMLARCHGSRDVRDVPESATEDDIATWEVFSG